jgi:hypothetical protein
MALLLHTGPNTDVFLQPVGTVQMQLQAQVQATPAATYRCAGCGDLLHFNALSASCRCIDECYSEPSDAAGTR